MVRKKKGLKGLFCIVVGIILGFIIGVVTITVLVSYRVDGLYKEITYLKSNIEDKDAKLQKLEKSINNKNYILKDLDIILIYEGEDEIDEISIKTVIKEKYKSLLGKEVKTIDADIAAEIIDKRILQFEHAVYKLKMEKLIIAETLKLWIIVEEIEY